jgi:hypothetical protein
VAPRAYRDTFAIGFPGPYDGIVVLLFMPRGASHQWRHR